MLRDGRLLSPCRWGIRSRVVAPLRLARPLGTFRWWHFRECDNVRALLISCRGWLPEIVTLGFVKRPHLSKSAPGSRGTSRKVNPRLVFLTCYCSLFQKGEFYDRRSAFAMLFDALRVEERNLTCGDPQVPIVGRPPYLNQSSYRSLGPIAGKARLQNRTWSFRLIRLL